MRIQTENTYFTVQYFMTKVFGLSGTTLLVYAVIYTFSAAERVLYASLENIADRTGTSVSSVKRALKYLLNEGYIVQCGETGQHTNIYKANMTMVEEAKRMIATGEASGILLKKVQNASVLNDDTETGSELNSTDVTMSPNNKELIKKIHQRLSAEKSARDKRFYDFETIGYEEIVELTSKQKKELIRLLGVRTMNRYISRLEVFMINNPSIYVKSHYKTILKWATEDAEL